MAKPSLEFVAGILRIWFSRGVADPFAFSYPEAEFLHVMNDADVSMILSTEDYHMILIYSGTITCAVEKVAGSIAEDIIVTYMRKSNEPNRV